MDELLGLGAAPSTNWEVQARGKNAHFKGGFTCGRKQMSLQCTLKHALVWSQQVLNVVFSVAPSSSPRIHRVPPPSCCTQSHPCLPGSSCQSHSVLPAWTNSGVCWSRWGMRWTCPVSPQCAEHTQSSEGAPVPRDEELHPPPSIISDFHWPGRSGKLMGSFSSLLLHH